MNREDAIEIAKAVMKKEGWPIYGKIEARLRRRNKILARILGPRLEWEIKTNVESRGCNARISIDDETSAVVAKYFAPR